MNGWTLTIKQGYLFILLGCMGLFSCHNKVLTEPTIAAEKKIFISQQGDQQYPPEKVLQQFKQQSQVQSQQLSESNTIRHQAPTRNDFLADAFHQKILKNGLIVDYLSRDDLPEINIMAVISTGRDQLNAQDELLSPLVLKLLKQGTQRYPKAKYQKMAALLGEPIRYWQTSRQSVISMTIMPQDIDLALSLLAQQIAYIEPDKNAFNKIKEQQLLENKLSQSSGSYLAKLFFYQNNYPEAHRYYRYHPNSSDIKKLTKTDVLSFYKKNYQAARTRLIIAGNFDVNSIQNKIERNFSLWDTVINHHDDEKLPPLLNKKVSQFDFIKRQGAQQIDLLYGVVSVPRSASDWLSLKLIAALLGGGPSSRLFTDLREKQGLAYFISAKQLSGRFQSPFFIQTAVAPDKLIAMINGINNHLEHLCHDEISSHELEQLKQQLSGEIMFKLQTNQQLVNNKLYQYENNLNNDYLLQQIQDISQITAQQLRHTARQYLCAQHNIIAVGDLDSVDQTLQKKLTHYQFRIHDLPLH